MVIDCYFSWHINKVIIIIICLQAGKTTTSVQTIWFIPFAWILNENVKVHIRKTIFLLSEMLSNSLLSKLNLTLLTIHTAPYPTLIWVWAACWHLLLGQKNVAVVWMWIDVLRDWRRWEKKRVSALEITQDLRVFVWTDGCYKLLVPVQKQGLRSHILPCWHL